MNTLIALCCSRNSLLNSKEYNGTTPYFVCFTHPIPFCDVLLWNLLSGCILKSENRFFHLRVVAIQLFVSNYYVCNATQTAFSTFILVKQLLYEGALRIDIRIKKS